MPEHTTETRLALIDDRLAELRKAVDNLATRMVTHADLAAATISRSAFESLEKRVVELERGSPNSIWLLAVKLAGGAGVLYTAFSLLKGFIR